ncbi:MAG: MFS transporter [Ectothiorhodospiraceae bacterium]|nr:MFS transporter [Ectothiorhodospiraceae bacterium]
MSTTEAAIGAPANGTKVIGLISAGHFYSHFFTLLLPPLFPLLHGVYGVSYTALGLAVSVYSITTGLLQAPMGFMVDRHGARRILLAGLLVESVAFALIGVFPVYGALVALMAVAGAADSVVHPADYTILSASVDRARMGRAFSIHTFAGFAGSAVAPFTVLALTAAFGWQAALTACGLAGVAVVGVMWLQSDLLRDRETAEADARGARAGGGGVRLLLTLPIVMALLFYVGISITGRGVSEFGVTSLHLLHGIDLTRAGAVVSAYLFSMPIGVLIGGVIADRVSRHDVVAASCFVIVGGCVIAIGSLDLDLTAVMALLVVAGLANGIVAPSRDMLVRRVTPPGQTGKVFGFVSTGFNIGGTVGPVTYGWILDHVDPRAVFWLAGTMALLTMLTVLETGRRGRSAAPG